MIITPVPTGPSSDRGIRNRTSGTPEFPSTFQIPRDQYSIPVDHYLPDVDRDSPKDWLVCLHERPCTSLQRRYSDHPEPSPVPVSTFVFRLCFHSLTKIQQPPQYSKIGPTSLTPSPLPVVTGELIPVIVIYDTVTQGKSPGRPSLAPIMSHKDESEQLRKVTKERQVCPPTNTIGVKAIWDELTPLLPVDIMVRV